MTDSVADRLAIAGEQLRLTSDKLRGGNSTPADLGALAEYLTELADHGVQLTDLALDLVEKAEQGHPVRTAPDGIDFQADLGHAKALFDAAMAFLYNAAAIRLEPTEGPS